MLFNRKILLFFKKKSQQEICIFVSKNIKNSIIEILKDIKHKKKKKRSILLSPAAASFDQFTNFEKGENEFKKLSKKYARKFI